MLWRVKFGFYKENGDLEGQNVEKAWFLYEENGDLEGQNVEKALVL